MGRCGARTRGGGSCRRRPAVGKRRCILHGGAAGIGAPVGNRNARTHGWYSAAEKEARRTVSALIEASLRTLRQVE